MSVRWRHDGVLLHLLAMIGLDLMLSASEIVWRVWVNAVQDASLIRHQRSWHVHITGTFPVMETDPLRKAPTGSRLLVPSARVTSLSWRPITGCSLCDAMSGDQSYAAPKWRHGGSGMTFTAAAETATTIASHHYCLCGWETHADSDVIDWHSRSGFHDNEVNKCNRIYFVVAFHWFSRSYNDTIYFRGNSCLEEVQVIRAAVFWKPRNNRNSNIKNIRASPF